MARKTGQIIRRGLQLWMVRIYVGHDPKLGNANTSANPLTAGCGPHRLISITCSRSVTLAGISDPRDKPWASISTTGSTSVPGRGCGLRASAITRPCSHGMSVHDWAA